MTPEEFEVAVAEFHQQMEAFHKFNEEVGMFISGDFAYVGVPAEFSPTVSCCDTTIDGVRMIGCNEEIAELSQFAVPVVTLPVHPTPPETPVE